MRVYEPEDRFGDHAIERETHTVYISTHLKQPVVPEIICNNDIVHGRHDKLDLRRVCSAGKVDKDLLGLGLVEGLELVGPVLAGQVIVVAPCCKD